MQDELIKLFAAYFTAHYFVNVVMIDIRKRLKVLPGKRVKPLDCTVCLSVWVALCLWFTPLGVSKFLVVLFGAGFLANKIQ